MVMETDPEQTHEVTVESGRRMYLVCMEGEMKLDDGTDISTREAVEIVSPTESKKLALTSGSNGMHLMAIEVAV